jgi:hypothetical protein
MARINMTIEEKPKGSVTGSVQIGDETRPVSGNRVDGVWTLYGGEVHRFKGTHEVLNYAAYALATDINASAKDKLTGTLEMVRYRGDKAHRSYTHFENFTS